MEPTSGSLGDEAPEYAQSQCDVSVILPTYCEAQNLPNLVPEIALAFDKGNLKGEILVVDDNSPDDTRAVCEGLSENYRLRLIVRTSERGLATAVIHGMREAQGAIFVVMDADLSHPPDKIPELVNALGDDQVDFVIGSRYVLGGSTEDQWSIFRRLNSKIATLLARPLSFAKDPMAGFFAIRRSTFERAPSLSPIGYKIGLELMVKAGCRSIREIPIAFRDRARGASKMTFKEQLNYLRHLHRLYAFKLGRFARPLQFVLVGSTGMVVDLLLFSLLRLVSGLEVARAVAIWVAMTWNFLLNRTLTFSYARSGSMVRQYVLFCLACLLGAIINWSVSVSLSRYVPLFARWEVLAAVCGIIAGTTSNYILSAYVVFKAKPEHIGKGADEA